MVNLGNSGMHLCVHYNIKGFLFSCSGSGVDLHGIWFVAIGGLLTA